MFTREQLDEAAGIIYEAMLPTPQICWPVLCQRAGCEVWVKHENHTPIGAFKIRGGLVFFDALKKAATRIAGGVTATRGNHGQSLAFAARRAGIPLAVVVPRGNSLEKNAAMKALGAELIESGRDFDEARAVAHRLAVERSWEMLPSFDPLLVRGVATYALEFFRATPPLDTIYVPIGLGSGICGVIGVRDLLHLNTRVVGVVAEGAPAYAESFEAGHAINTKSATTIADGIACRIPDPHALEIIRRGAKRIVRVAESEIIAAMRAFFTDTHNLAEGAAAAGLAALLKEKQPGKRAGVVLTGANVDLARFTEWMRKPAGSAAVV